MLCGGDATLAPPEGLRAYLKEESAAKSYTSVSYQRAGWLGNASSAWLWDPQSKLGSEPYYEIQNHTFPPHIRINRVEYSGFLWKFKFDNDEQLLSGDLPPQTDEVDRVLGENFPDCKLEKILTSPLR